MSIFIAIGKLIAIPAAYSSPFHSTTKGNRMIYKNPVMYSTFDPDNYGRAELYPYPKHNRSSYSTFYFW